LVGEELRLRLSPPAGWELVRRTQLVGSLKLYTPGELAHIACRDGDWSLKQRRRYG
jgi:hypothetical protein